MLNTGNSAFIFYDAVSENILGQNDLANQFEDVFSENISDIYTYIKEAIQNIKSINPARYYNIRVKTNKNETVSCNLEVGVINELLSHIYIKIEPCGQISKDTHEYSSNIFNTQSSFLIENDDCFSLINASPQFYDDFSFPKHLMECGSKSFLQIFPRDVRGFYFDRMKEMLSKEDHFLLEVNMCCDSSKNSRYFIDFHKMATQSQIYGVIINRESYENKAECLSRSQEYLSIMQEISPGSFFIVDIESKTLTYKDEKLKSFGIPRKIENFPESLNDIPLFHVDDIPEYIEFLSKAMGGISGTHRVRIWHQHERVYTWYQTDCRVLTDNYGIPIEVIGQIMPIQDKLELEEKAYTDSLTGALNKMAFKDKTSEFLRDCELHDMKGALLFLDLDDFKRINDSYGHTFGDFILNVFVKRLRGCIRGNDLLGRVGGDEFVILLKKVPSTDFVLKKAADILIALNRVFSDGEISCNVTASVGVALTGTHGTTFEELYKNADKALYTSKDQGKDTATLASVDYE